MALLGNIATRMGWAPQAGAVKAPAPVAPKALGPRLGPDAFVRQEAPKPTLSKPGLPPRVAAPAKPLAAPAPGFAELIATDPSKVWTASPTARVEAAIASYRQGKLGESVRELDLRRQTVNEVRDVLKAKGFSVEQGHITDVRTGKPAVNPVTGEIIPMEIWTHPDGGMVRVKPEGDPTSKFRPQPHLSVSVKYPPDASGHDFNNEAFKVDHAGNPLPKWAKDAANPYGADTPAGKKFLDDLANGTHVNLI